VATFGASTGKPNPGTAAITTRSALLLAIEGEVAELNNRLIPLSIRRRRESPAWQDPFEFADSFGSRTGQLAVFPVPVYQIVEPKKSNSQIIIFNFILIVCSVI
jgi:hypothetical protein